MATHMGQGKFGQGKEGSWVLEHSHLSKAEQMLQRHLETLQAKQFSELESQSLAKTYILNSGSLSPQVEKEQCLEFSCHLGRLCLEPQTMGLNKPLGLRQELARANQGHKSRNK